MKETVEEGAIHSILVATGRTKAAVAAERDKFKVPTVKAAIQCAAKRRITAA